MHTRLFVIVVGFVSILSAVRAYADEPSAARDETLRDLPAVTGYYGGIPFYTAFHQSMTTRLLLLKGAHDNAELKEYLELSESQLATIKTLQVSQDELLSDEQKSTLLDINMAVDEELFDPEFYGFLNADQRESLDRLALEFDGLAGLTRTSIAERIGLSATTRDAVGKTLVSFRKKEWLPYSRWEFAAKLPSDSDFRRCVFVGEFLYRLNQEIVGHLSDDERKSLAEWMSRTERPHKVIEAVKRKAPLPDGLFALYVYMEKER